MSGETGANVANRVAVGIRSVHVAAPVLLQQLGEQIVLEMGKRSSSATCTRLQVNIYH